MSNFSGLAFYSRYKAFNRRAKLGLNTRLWMFSDKGSCCFTQKSVKNKWTGSRSDRFPFS